MNKQKTFTVTVKDYGDNEINFIAIIVSLYNDLTAPEMQRVHGFISSKYRDMLSQRL